MKLFKSLFSQKPKQNTKYEPNTLAEMNGSPDLRLATAKEKEVDYPLVINDEVKKIPKKSSKSATTKSGASSAKRQTAKKSSTEKNDKIKPVSETKAATVSVSASAKPSKNTKNVGVSEKDPAKPVAKKTPSATAKKEASKATQVSAKSANDPTKSSAVRGTEKINESKVTRAGKFEIKKSKDGRFVFNLYASNNVIVATSQVYSSSTSAMNGIKSVIANAASAQIEDQSLKKVTQVPFPKWEIYLDKGDQYRFRLCASNGSCVCHSQGYTSKANCKKGIESIIKFASDAEITKAYLDKKEK